MRALLPLFLLLLLAGPALAAELNATQQREAARLFTALGCRGCHDFAKSGSTLASSLDRIGLKLSAAQILQILQQPPQQSPPGEKFMPSYRTTPRAQLELLSDYLAARK